MKLGTKERPPVFAGTWYESDRKQLEESLDSLIKACKKSPSLGNPKAAISPVAGYKYSGQATAASFVALSANVNIERVLLIANSYNVPSANPSWHGIALTDFDTYRTPLGVLPVDREFCEFLATDDLFRAPFTNVLAHNRIEVQLPMLQRTMGNVKIVPMFVGYADENEIFHISRIIRDSLHSKSVLVVCSPLSTTFLDGFPSKNKDYQTKPNEFVYSLDQEAVNLIVNLDYHAFSHYCNHRNRSMANSESIEIGIGALQGWCVGKILDHYISSDVTGNASSSQSYASVLFYERFLMEKSWISFLCHSSKDKELVERIANDLRHSGVNVWLDKWQLKAGDSLNTRIQSAIKQSGYLVVFLSQSSTSSPWVQRELNAALIKELEINRVFVVPVVLDNCDIPVFLRDKIYADFRTDYDSGLETLMSALLTAPSARKED